MIKSPHGIASLRAAVLLLAAARDTVRHNNAGENFAPRPERFPIPPMEHSSTNGFSSSKRYGRSNIE
jgi:hypothetical protein